MLALLNKNHYTKLTLKFLQKLYKTHNIIDFKLHNPEVFSRKL